MAPTDGRLTSQPLFTGSLAGSEFIMLVSPGNAATGINYKMQASTLASFIMPSGGTSLPLVSNGPTANPSFQLLTVPGGGLGTASLGTGVVLGEGVSAPITIAPATSQVLAANNGTPVWTGALTLATSITAPLVIGGTAGFGTETNPQGIFVLSNYTVTSLVWPTAFGNTNAPIVIGNSGVAPGGWNGLTYGGNSQYLLGRADGTPGSPTAVQTAEIIGAINFLGYDGTVAASGARIAGIALNAWSTTDHSGYLELGAVPSGTTTRSVAAAIMGGVSIGASTATDPGKGRLLVLAGSALVSAGTAAILMSNVATFGIFCGTGVPSVTAATGSLYFRNDGATATTRIYVNSSGGTTWVGLTATG